jgi:PIN domain nuclease of toxin-antitoxin system
VVLLDASALIAALYGEPGADTVAEHLGDASVVTINLEEVAGRLLRDGMDMATARRTIDALDVDMVEFTVAMAWRSAELRALLPIPLGIADRACLAAASVLATPVITADAAWRDAGDACQVRVISLR